MSDTATLQALNAKYEHLFLLITCGVMWRRNDVIIFIVAVMVVLMWGRCIYVCVCGGLLCLFVCLHKL